MPENEGAGVAGGLCIEYRGSGESYLLVLDAVGRLCREVEAVHILSVSSKYAPTWLQQMPGAASAEQREAPQPPIPGVTRDRMRREMAEALEALTADRPLELVLENLHRSDCASLDLIAWLAPPRTGRRDCPRASLARARGRAGAP